MKPNLRKIQSRKRYSEGFKKYIVKEFEQGIKVLTLCKLHNLTENTVYRWIYKYTDNEKNTHIVEMKHSSSEKLKLLESRIKELEQIVGQKQIKLEYLEKMIELAKDELDIDIKKNFNTQPLTGSDNTENK
jgi:transposase-like protein